MPDRSSIPDPRAPRYRSLDLWRGVACLLVVVFHSTSVAALSAEAPGGTGGGPGAFLLDLTRIGWVGVPFFFVISGYAISATADVFRRQAGGAGTYFRRRIRRIYPPYWAMLALQVVLVFAIDVALRPGLLTSSIAPIDRPWDLSVGQWLGNLTLTESWRATALPFRSDQAFILGQAWTLCYEEQFYLVAGLAVLLWPRRYFAVAAALTAITVVAPFAAHAVGIRVAGFFFDGYWLAFAAGVLVYWQVNYGARRNLPGVVLLLAGGLGYAFLMRTGFGDRGRDLAAAMGFALLLLPLHRFDARLTGSRLLRPLGFAGTICYSLYLSHAVVVRSLSQALYDAGLRDAGVTVAIVLPVCVAVAVVVGWAFHRLVERHFLNRTPGPSTSGFTSPATEPAAPAAPPRSDSTAPPG